MSKEPPNRDNRARKGILKSLRQSSAGASSERRKSAHWQEENIQETLQRANKDYELMKIDEPKTPFNWESGCDPELPSTSHAGVIAPGVDADKMKEKLQKYVNLDELLGQKNTQYDEYRQLKAANVLLRKVSKLEDKDDETEEQKPDGSSNKKAKEEKTPGLIRKSSPTAQKRLEDTEEMKNKHLVKSLMGIIQLDLFSVQF